MNRKITFSFVVLLAGVLACVVPPGMTPTPPAPLIVTQVMVVTSEQIQPSPTLPLPTEPVATDTTVPTSTPVSTATATATATLSGPVITFNENANCRKGPSTAYEVVTSFYEGETLKILGRNPNYNNTWWYVEIPSGGKCWVSLTTGQAYGDFDAIPTVTP